MKKILDNFPSQSKNIIYTYSTLCRIIDVNKTNHHTFLSNGKLLAFVSGEGIRIIIDFHLNILLKMLKDLHLAMKIFTLNLVQKYLIV